MDLAFNWLRNNSALALTEHVAPSSPAFTIAQPSELEDASEFIQPNSLVLTVGIAFKDRPRDIGSYIDHLADAGAVAVGFGTGLTFAEVPKLVVETARRRGIGLYEVPRRIPFIGIVTAVHQEQQRRQVREQQQLIDAQERLTTAAIPSSLSSLLAEASSLLSAHIRVTSAGGALIAEAGSAGSRPSRTTQRLAAGTLHLHASRRIPPALIRHLAGLVDMLLARPAELRAARNDLNSFAIALRLKLIDATTPIPTDFPTPATTDGLTRPLIIAADQPRALERARLALDTDAEAHGQFLYAVDLSGGVFAVFVHPDRPVDEVIAALGSAARRVRVVVGRPVPASEIDAEHLSALRTRCRTLALGDHALPATAHSTWLSEPAVAEALHLKRLELLGVLEREDATHGTDYVRTLTVYLRNGGHLTATADALGIHRHTARTRVARIQDLCGVDLTDPATLAEAYFAVAAGAVD